METLTLSLLHDGRFHEAQEMHKLAEGLGYRFAVPWFRIALGQHDWSAAEAIASQERKSDKGLASYMAALLNLELGRISRCRRGRRPSTRAANAPFGSPA